MALVRAEQLTARRRATTVRSVLQAEDLAAVGLVRAEQLTAGRSLSSCKSFAVMTESGFFLLTTFATWSDAQRLKELLAAALGGGKHSAEVGPSEKILDRK